MTAERGRIDELRQSLEADPYSAGLLAELTLLQIADGDSIAVAALLRSLGRMNRPLSDVFARIAEHPDRLAAHDGYLTYGPVTIEERQSIDTALAFARSEWGGPIPAMLVEFARQDGIPTFAHIADDSFAYICLGARDCEVATEALVHEMAHARFPTGLRYMDEGIATLFEARFKHRDLEQRRAEMLTLDSTLLRTRALLTYHGAQDPFFSKLDAAVAPLVHDHAALFMGAVINRVGIPALHALCSELRERASDVRAAEIIESATGVSLEDLDPAIAELGNEGGGHTEQGVSADIVDRVHRATLRLDAREIGALKECVEDIVPLDRARDAASLEAWCRILIFELLGGMLYGNIEERDVIVADSALERFAAVSHNKPLVTTLQALLGIARVPLEPDQLAGLARLTEVRQSFDRALRMEPDNLDAMVQKARFTLLTPDEYAVDKAGALATMRELAERIDYGADVAAGMQAAGLVS